MNIRNKLILSTTIGLIIIYAAITLFIRQQLRDKIIKDAIEEMQLTAFFIESKIEQHTIHVEEIIQNTARQISSSNLNEQQITDLIEQTLHNNKGEIYGISFAYDTLKKYSAPYVYYQDSDIQHKNLASIQDYHYPQSIWYQEAKNDSLAGWTSSYFDNGGGDAKMITYYHPVVQNGQLLGYLNGDLRLDWLNDWIHQKFTEKFTHHKWISSKNPQDWITNPKDFEIDLEKFHLFESPQLQKEITLRTNTDSKDPIFLLSLPLQFNQWNVQIAFKTSDILQSYHDTILYLKIAFALGLILLIILISTTVNLFTKPLIILSKSISAIGNGRFNLKIPYQNRKDEIGVLAHSFTNMQEDLKKHIKNLKATTKENTRIQNELDIGHQIQMSLLPEEHSLQHLPYYQIKGFMQAAKEVGGDLYDFFETTNGNICFVVGDVSGKGIPAALWMASVRASIRAYAQMGLSPAEILTKVNADICKRNTLFNFVTLFCAITDQAHQQIIFCNAGHERPYLLQKGEKPQEIISSPQMALGISPKKIYQNETISITQISTIVVYSDGVTDATNIEDEAFGKDNFKQILSTHTDVDDIVSNTQKSIQDFCIKAEPFDDITVLAIQIQFEHYA